MLEKTVTTPSLAALLAPAARAGDDRAATGTADQGEHARALAVYRAHAERGDGNAQEIVALMLWVGDALHEPEVPRDRVAATESPQRSAAQGNETARGVLGTPGRFAARLGSA